MTGFASRSGQNERLNWDWELRTVNSRGLDIRLRLPEGCEGLEPGVRKAAGKALKRGNVSISLKLRQKSGAAAGNLDLSALRSNLERLGKVQAVAAQSGLELAPMNAADLLALPGVVATDEETELPSEISDDLTRALDDLVKMRAVEGAAMGLVIAEHLDAMGNLVVAAEKTAEARAARAGELLKEKVAALLDAHADADSERLSQELAILSTKADVTEEVDRLRAHIDAAREILDKGGPVGRQLDFLMQEFNREANTLCSKSGSTDLTAIGLDLKLRIEQMREQVQNLE